MATFYRADGWVKSVQGQAIAGAQVYICLQPADSAFLPPVPLASIFLDPQGISPVTQPLITDGFGHFDYYAASGVPYTEVVVNGGKVQASYQDQIPMGATLGSSLPPFPGNPAVFLNGAGAFSAPPAGGSGTVTNTSGPLTAGQLVLGNGGSDVMTGPVFPGDATKFLNGTGAFSVPAGGGSGTVTNTGALTLNAIILGNAAADIKAGVTLPGSTSVFLNGAGAFTTPPVGTGTVTNTSGDLTANALVVGNGTVDEKVLTSLGTTTTVLHGNAAGLPSFGAVVEGDITLANNSTNNVSTAAHGFAPILPNDATVYLDGTGHYTLPAGGGGSSAPQDTFWYVADPVFPGFIPASTPNGKYFVGYTVWQDEGGGGAPDTAPDGTHEGCYKWTTGAGATASAGFDTVGDSLYIGLTKTIRWRVKLGQTANMRIWMGLAGTFNYSLSDFRTDTPIATHPFAMFRYSTAAGDTKYQCITQDAASATTNPETTASHVDSTTFHEFEIQYVSPNVLFLIDGVQVGSQSTNVDSNAKMNWYCFIDNVGVAVADSFELCHVRGNQSAS